MAAWSSGFSARSEIVHNGAPACLRAAKPRQLLTLLATRPGEPVPAPVLVDELWEGVPPSTASSALRTHVTQVRRALEPDRLPGLSTRLPLEPSGYVLHMQEDELDSRRFEALVDSAHEADELGDPIAAESHLVAALALWRGPALADAHGLAAVCAELARLTELRMRAIEQLAEARLSLGRHGALVEVLLDAVEEFPLHEKFAAQLMLAFYRSGRQADALGAFRRLEQQLDQQLGIPPSPELRRLEEDVLLQRAHLESLPRGADRHVAAISPFTSPRLVGRREELGRLLAAGEEAAGGERRLVLLSGPSGIGKTTLAAELCARLGRRGASVFTGACFEDRVGGSEPVIEILADVTRMIGSARVAELGWLDPEHRAGDGSADTLVGRDLESDQLRMFETIAAALARLGDRPVVLRVEDLHWAGRTTLLVLRYLLRVSELEKLLVVATVRDEDLDAERAELIADLAPAARTRLVPLSGFDDHEVRSLIRNSCNARGAIVEVAPKIRDATDGNPFFIRALLRDLEQLPDDRDGLESRVRGGGAERGPGAPRSTRRECLTRRAGRSGRGRRARRPVLVRPPLRGVGTRTG